MNIIPVIRDLLLRDQKVIVPGLGTFAIIQRPAQINKVTRVITPPKMIIRFDRHHQNDDGSLLGYLVRKLKQETEISEKAISEFSALVNNDLHQKSRSSIEGLGTLTKQVSGEITFDPDEELLRRISLFELPKINIPAPPPEKTPVIEVSHVQKEERKHRWWLAALVLFVILLIGFLAPIYFTGNMDTLFSDIKALISGEDKPEEQNKLVFGPARENEDTSQVARQLEEQVNRDKALSMEKQVAAPERAKEPQPSISTRPEVNGVDADKPYHIISGAFLVPNNAERHVEILEKSGIHAVILPKKGDYYMVSAGAFSSLAEAKSAMKELQGKVRNELWVMKR